MKLLLLFRRILGVIFLIGFLMLFLDIWGASPSWLKTFAQIQIVPLAMHTLIVAVVLWAVLTLLFGRVYCAIFCPLGLLQDVILRIKRRIYLASDRRKALQLKYKKAWNVVRYGSLAIAVFSLCAGFSYPVALLDPYSNFGRIATALFRPVVVWANNISVDAINSISDLWLYAVPQTGVAWVTIIFSVTLLSALVVMVFFSAGRLWCNTICPVGAFLGLFSRFSLFKIRLDKEHCNSCGLCAMSCKASCIDPANKSVDASRCVACFSCGGRCSKEGVRFSWRNKGQKIESAPENSPQFMESRRRFIKGSLVVAAAAPVVAMAKTMGVQSDLIIKPLPPGAISLERFRDKCTACQLCISKCPTHVLQPAFLENGPTSMMQPIMVFDLERFCNYECNECGMVCPNDAIKPLSPEEKKLTRVGYARFYKDRCRVSKSKVDCGACAEHCPSQALHMVSYQDGLTIPEIDPDLCIGCGGCESICPVTPKAVVVEGIAEQNMASPPQREAKDDLIIDDFGF